MRLKSPYNKYVTNNQGYDHIFGSFTASSTTDPSVFEGSGFTVDRLGTGIYQVALSCLTGRVQGVVANAFLFGTGATAENDDAKILTTSQLTGGTDATPNFTIVTQTADGTAGYLHGKKVGFHLWLRGTTNTGRNS